MTKCIFCIKHNIAGEHCKTPGANASVQPPTLRGNASLASLVQDHFPRLTPVLLKWTA